MTAERPAPMGLGGDVHGLRTLAVTLTGYLPEITGVIAALNQEVSGLTGGDPGWHGPAAAAFTAAWRRDAAAVQALAEVIGQTASVVEGLAAELAVIERALEDEAHTAARYGVKIGTDGQPPPVPAGPPGSAAEASERHWARAYRQAHERAMADAQRVRARAAGRLEELYAAITPSAQVTRLRCQRP